MRAIKILPARKTATHDDDKPTRGWGRVDITVHVEFPAAGKLARAVVMLKVLTTVTIAALGGGAVRETIWHLAKLLFGHGG